MIQKWEIRIDVPDEDPFDVLGIEEVFREAYGYDDEWSILSILDHTPKSEYAAAEKRVHNREGSGY